MFIMVDLGQPIRALNLFLHPTPNSMLFWDAMVLRGYLALNIICSWVILTLNKNKCNRRNGSISSSISPFHLPSLYIPVTAMLYCGLPGRHFWLSAITAPRFLASAFAAGPTLIVIASLIMKKVAQFDAGDKAISKLITIIIYAALLNAFFILLEFFVAYYSNIPGHKHTIEYLFFGIKHQGHTYNNLIPLMWTSVGLCGGGVGVLVTLKLLRSLPEVMTGIGCGMIFISLWLDKGIGFVLGGLATSPLNEIVEYSTTANEIAITLGIWASGLLLITLLYKIGIGVQREIRQ
jgi:molybdopterin-containing oxidoreductase family membrane subunit